MRKGKKRKQSLCFTALKSKVARAMEKGLEMETNEPELTVTGLLARDVTRAKLSNKGEANGKERFVMSVPCITIAGLCV